MNQKRPDEKRWFKDIFNKNYEYVRNYLYYLSGDMGLAEDLAQDAFLRLWEKRDRVQDLTLRSFLFTIARNNFLKNRREAKNELKFRSTIFDQLEEKSPEYIFEMQEFDKKLQQTISAMSAKSRAIFLMNRMDGMTYSEIAWSLQISVKAVEKQMSKALSFLKENLGKKV